MKSTLLEIFYFLAGFISIFTSILILKSNQIKNKRFNALFFLVFGIIISFGKYMPSYIVGVLLLFIGLLSLTKKIIPQMLIPKNKEKQQEKATLYKNLLFIPALSIGIISFLIAFIFPKLGALVGLGIGSMLSLIMALLMFRESPVTSLKEGSSLLSNIGSVIITPPLLASLGAVFNVAGVGEIISSTMSQFFDKNNLFIGVSLYCVGMATFTIIMGNAFVAFAVITAGIGIPFVFSQGANPSVAGLLGLTAGYCGTLMTPMAAVFNIMPVAILETKNQYSIIKAQIPIAILLLIIHIFLMYYLAF